VVIDLSPEHLQLMREILPRHVPEREVWLFGSRVTGKAARNSDVDLMILGAEGLSFREMEALWEAFSLSDLPYMVDLVNWSEASAGLRALVAGEHAVVQAGKVCLQGGRRQR
jgi:predicted nucleotidyltransferase